MFDAVEKTAAVGFADAQPCWAVRGLFLVEPIEPVAVLQPAIVLPGRRSIEENAVPVILALAAEIFAVLLVMKRNAGTAGLIAQ